MQVCPDAVGNKAPRHCGVGTHAQASTWVRELPTNACVFGHVARCGLVRQCGHLGEGGIGRFWAGTEGLHFPKCSSCLGLSGALFLRCTYAVETRGGAQQLRAGDRVEEPQGGAEPVFKAARLGFPLALCNSDKPLQRNASVCALNLRANRSRT